MIWFPEHHNILINKNVYEGYHLKIISFSLHFITKPKPKTNIIFSDKSLVQQRNFIVGILEFLLHIVIEHILTWVNRIRRYRPAFIQYTKEERGVQEAGDNINSINKSGYCERVFLSVCFLWFASLMAMFYSHELAFLWVNIWYSFTFFTVVGIWYMGWRTF